MTRPAASEALYSIRDLAASFGVTPRALRFYEQQGLITPRRKGATRLYTAADRARLILILRGKRVGFSLAEIKEMLDLEATQHASRAHLEGSIERFRARIEDLKRQRDDIDEAISELEAGCTWMEERLNDREPPEDIKRRARAFEALAAARLVQWSVGPPD
ncbi:MAG: MerR family DNA-binding transcriptional regulator [Oceanicaulis sp.]|uniref:MerR family transcriptional regulator n=1 Tax=Glycocaulis sp. TaxID=1969725 RepID=UPI0025B86692|nr:MerR family DNA-binding transcriptional regulator [Glycocaulis sp.]MCC5981126.1 MerR family DNA-binding transcriptional regulator [Oceanicaulis sp.]MCH8520366.1 MerR family DNA-binding transcriptional regulator [Glycocaulis sp.]